MKIWVQEFIDGWGAGKCLTTFPEEEHRVEGLPTREAALKAFRQQFPSETEFEVHDRILGFEIN